MTESEESSEEEEEEASEDESSIVEVRRRRHVPPVLEVRVDTTVPNTLIQFLFRFFSNLL